MQLVIFDKDRTLVCPKSGGKWVQSPDDQVLLPGVQEKLEQLRNDGVGMAIATNQGGVISGHKSLEAAIYEVQFAIKLTGIQQALLCPDDGETCVELFQNKWQVLVGSWKGIDRVYSGLKEDGYYPYKRFDSSLSNKKAYENYGSFRKPGGGMIAGIHQVYYHTISSDDVLFVGDRPEDQKAAASAGVEFEWAKDFFGR